MLIDYREKLKEYRFKSLIGECTKGNRKILKKLEEWNCKEWRNDWED